MIGDTTGPHVDGKLSQRIYYGPKVQLLRYISYQENIDTTTPTGELIFHVMASLAQFESALISQRVHAGMAQAKAQDKHVARSKLVQAKLEAIAQLVRESLVSKLLDVAYGTVYNYAQKLKST